jgi:hypothetical protein
MKRTTPPPIGRPHAPTYCNSFGVSDRTTVCTARHQLAATHYASTSGGARCGDGRGERGGSKWKVPSTEERTHCIYEYLSPFTRMYHTHAHAHARTHYQPLLVELLELITTKPTTIEESCLGYLFCQRKFKNTVPNAQRQITATTPAHASISSNIANRWVL